MTNEYNCNDSFSNLGAIDCINKMGTPRRVIIVPLYDADGDPIEWANLAAFTKASLQSKINATDIKDRIFPVDFINNVEQTREDVKVETDDYDIDYFIRHGVKSFQAMLWGASYNYMQRLSAYNYLSNLGVILIDNNTGVICKTDLATRKKIQPIPIRSFYVSDVPATSESVLKAKIQWKYALEGNEYLSLMYLEPSQLDFNGLSKVDLYSLYDVALTVGTPTTGGAVVSAYIDGNINQPVYGLVAGDFTVLKGVTPITPTITTSVNGVYTMTWTATAGDYTITASKNRYDFGAAVAFTIS